MLNKFRNKKYIKAIKKKDEKIVKKKLINNTKSNKRKCTFNILLFIILIIENTFLILIYIIPHKQKIVNSVQNFLRKNITSSNTTFEYNLEKHYYSRGKTLDRGLPFIQACLQGNLTNNPQNFKYTPNPRISAVIPSYNCERTLKAAVRSIQNQDMFDLEIILVNDNSNQKTLDLLEELRKEDPRIKVIHNTKRRGQFYSRNIGALESKGEYIVNLDSDDMYVDTDVFNTLYYAIKDGDFDILAHKMFEAYSFTNRYYIREHLFNGRRHNFTLFQPRLSCYPISSNGNWKLNDLNIWGKLYKSSIYKSAVNVLGVERYSYYAVFIEDYLMLYFLCNIASSFKFIKKYGLFHKVSSSSNSNRIKENERLFGDLFFTEIILDFGRLECKHLSVKRFISFYKGFKGTNEENKNYYIRIYKKIMADYDVNDTNKEIVRNKYGNYTEFNKFYY